MNMSDNIITENDMIDEAGEFGCEIVDPDKYVRAYRRNRNIQKTLIFLSTLLSFFAGIFVGVVLTL